MQIYRYATVSQIQIEASSQEEADAKLGAMTPDEVLAEMGGVECFDIIDLEEIEEEEEKEEAARQWVAQKLARRKTEMAEKAE
jgi:hypothetical protein